MIISMEKRLKNLEASNEDISNAADNLQSETSASLQDLHTKLTNNMLAISQNKEDLENFTQSLDKIAREGAQDISQETSDDNPEHEQVIYTFADLVGKGIK